MHICGVEQIQKIAAKITGNINIETANETKVKFNGNQSLKK